MLTRDRQFKRPVSNLEEMQNEKTRVSAMALAASLVTNGAFAQQPAPKQKVAAKTMGSGERWYIF